MNRVKIHFWMMMLMTLMTAASGCTRAVDRQASAQAIRDTETQWNREWVNRDLDRVAGHYSEDAVLMVPGMGSTVGTQNIRKALEAMAADPAFSLKFSAARIEVASSGDLAFAQGSYLLTITDPQTKKVVHDTGSYVTTYRRESDGAWRAVTDIATSTAWPNWTGAS